MHVIHHIILQYSYAGIFGLLMLGIIGIPVPDETLLAFCGYLAHKGELQLIFTLLSAFLGSCSGITVSYFIGRVPGMALIKKFGSYVHVTDERIQRIHTWFRKIGRWLLIVGYFIPGFRHLSAIVAGSSRLSFPEFAPFAYAGALIWSTTFVMAGYIFEKEWRNMSGKARDIFLIVAGAVLVLGTAWWLYRFFSRKKKQEPAS